MLVWRLWFLSEWCAFIHTFPLFPSLFFLVLQLLFFLPHSSPMFIYNSFISLYSPPMLCFAPLLLLFFFSLFFCKNNGEYSLPCPALPVYKISPSIKSDESKMKYVLPQLYYTIFILCHLISVPYRKTKTFCYSIDDDQHFR